MKVVLHRATPCCGPLGWGVLLQQAAAQGGAPYVLSKLIATCGCKDSDSPGSSWVQQRQCSRGDWHTFCQCASCQCASCRGWDSPAPEPCGERALRPSPHHTRWRRAPLHRRTAGPYPHCAAGQSCGYTIARYRGIGAVWGRTGLAERGVSPDLSSTRDPRVRAVLGQLYRTRMVIRSLPGTLYRVRIHSRLILPVL